jgi:hypothetical protein
LLSFNHQGQYGENWQHGTKSTEGVTLLRKEQGSEHLNFCSTVIWLIVEKILVHTFATIALNLIKYSGVHKSTPTALYMLVIDDTAEALKRYKYVLFLLTILTQNTCLSPKKTHCS